MNVNPRIRPLERVLELRAAELRAAATQMSLASSLLAGHQAFSRHDLSGMRGAIERMQSRLDAYEAIKSRLRNAREGTAESGVL